MSDSPQNRNGGAPAAQPQHQHQHGSAPAARPRDEHQGQDGSTPATRPRDQGQGQDGSATAPRSGASRHEDGDGTARSAVRTQDDGRTVAQLQRRLAEFAAARGWGQYHTPKNLAAALSVEAGELVEIFQWLTPEQSARVMADDRSAARVEDEVADVLAYLLQFCEVLGVDALAALEAKIERNETRFPTLGNGHSME